MTETLSQLASDFDDDDLASSILKEPQIEGMCYGLSYTPLDYDGFLHLQIYSKASNGLQSEIPL